MAGYTSKGRAQAPDIRRSRVILGSEIGQRNGVRKILILGSEI